MRYDDYAGAIDHAYLQRCLERCQALDELHPRDLDRCAREVVRDCTCPCIASEERICNALANSVSEAMFETACCL
jgi:hypothetical protein